MLDAESHVPLFSVTPICNMATVEQESGTELLEAARYENTNNFENLLPVQPIRPPAPRYLPRVAD